MSFINNNINFVYHLETNIKNSTFNMDIKGNIKLSDLVITDYRTSEVLEKYNIDYFNGGDLTLFEALNNSNIDLENLIMELKTTIEGENDNPQFNNFSIDSLLKYVKDVHHEYIRNTFPVLNSLTKEISITPKNPSSELLKLAELYEALKEELEIHIQKEEKMIFPYLSELLEKKNRSLTFEAPPFGSIAHLVEVMGKEHYKTAEILNDMRKLTNNYSTPENTGLSIKVLYDELRKFEKDLHYHIHLENNILFPKAIALENEIKETKSIN